MTHSNFHEMTGQTAIRYLYLPSIATYVVFLKAAAEGDFQKMILRWGLTCVHVKNDVCFTIPFNIAIQSVFQHQQSF